MSVICVKEILLCLTENIFYVFRRGRPLFLDHKRLEALRKVWMDQLVPLETRRIIEMGLNGLGP